MSTIDDKDNAAWNIGHLEAIPDATGKTIEGFTPGEEREGLGFWIAVKTYRKAVFWAAVMSCTLVMEGYDRALIGNFWALPAFSERYGVYVASTKTYTVQAQWQLAISNFGLVGCFMGALSAGWEVERFGYRRTVLFNLLFLIPAIAVVTFAPNVIALFMGEWLCGLPWGVFAVLGPSYASEVCPISLRAYLTTYVNLCWVMGQFIASGVVLGIQGMSGQWAYRIPFAIQWIWPLILIPTLWFAPESPWWLVRHGKLEEAKVSIRSLVNCTDSNELVDETLAMMIETNRAEEEAKHNNKTMGTSYLDCFRGSNLRRTEISAMAWASQILSGDGFAGFVQAGTWKHGGGIHRHRGLVVPPCSLRSSDNLHWWPSVACSVVARYRWTFHCRRPRAEEHQMGSSNLVPGLGSIVRLDVGAYRLLQKTVAISRNTFYVFSIISGIVSPYMLNPQNWNWRGKSAFFWSAPALACAIWGYFRLGEMKGRSYYEIDILFERRVSARQFAKTDVSAEAHELERQETKA